MIEKWDHIVTSNLKDDDPFWALRDVLIQMKSEGFSSDDAYAYFDGLREKAPDEKTRDKILDAMDIIVGWCSPHVRVWLLFLFLLVGFH